MQKTHWQIDPGVRGGCLLVPLPAAAQAKIRIAIWDFENNSAGSYWFSHDLGKAARNQIDTFMAENAALSAKFSVVEREKLELVMKEQGLSSAGALDPQSAAKVGRILGVKYIVTGGIDKFSINKTGGGIGRLGVGGSVTTADATHQHALHRHDDRRAGRLDIGRWPGEEGRWFRGGHQSQPGCRVGHRQRSRRRRLLKSSSRS